MYVIARNLLSKVFFVLLTALFASHLAFAQDYINGTGAPVFSTSASVELGFIDLSNGNLHLEVPIASPAQRGPLSVSEKLVYDSRIWSIVDNGSSKVWQPNTQTAAWRFTHAVKTGSVTYDANVYTCPDPSAGSYTAYTNFVWTSPNGTQFMFPITTTAGCGTDVVANDALAANASGFHMWVDNYTDAWVDDPKGVQTYPNPRDSNGNYMSKHSNGDLIDTLGRTPVTTSTVGNQTFLDVLNSQNTTSRYTLNYTNTSVSTAFGVSGVTEYSGTLSLLTSVQLPNNLGTYTFTYDSYGELASVTLPTGGQITYGYTNFTDSYGQMNRWISSRISGGTWSYVPTVVTTCPQGGQGCQQKVTVTKPSSDSIQFLFTLNGGAWNSQATYYNSSGTLMATVANDYDFSGSCSGCTGAAYVTKSRRTTTLPTAGGGSISSKSEYTYNSQFTSFLIAQKDWNFYTGTPSANPDRETDIAYVTDDPHISKNQRQLPTSITLKNAAGAQVAQTLYTWDRYDLTGLSSVPGIVQHDDTEFDINRTLRANVTTVQRWVSGSTYLTTAKYWYDTTGQVTQSADSAGNVTSYDYSDAFKIDNGANPPADYTPSSSTHAHVTTTSVPIIGSQFTRYYWGSSKTAYQKDQNSQYTYYHYIDPLDRPTLTKDPAGGWIDTVYTSLTQTDTYTAINDTTPSPSCTSCRHDQTLVDGYGRPSRTALVSDPQGATYKDTAYDTNGRVVSSSNSYRSTTDPTYGTKSSNFDGIDRIIQITKADGNSVTVAFGPSVGAVSQFCSTTTYGIGYPILSTDEAGKKRLLWYNAFDQLIEADEPNSSNILNVATCYKYDGLGNLAQVIQQAQTRTYAYDGLSRLTSSTVPEGGTTTYSYLNGSSVCSGNPGNPCSQTNARGITTTYHYDALNRITQRNYSDGTRTTAYHYDETTNWGFTLTNTQGRLTHISAWDSKSERIFSYDAMGRIIMQSECLPSNCGSSAYTTYLTYNAGGQLTSIQYPSGRKVTYSYTNAARTSSVVLAQMNGQSMNYAYASGLSYTPNGLPTNLTYDNAASNGISETLAYNKRWQLTSDRLASSALTFMNHTLNFVDGSGHDNGDVQSITDVLNSARTQSFTYDQLDRLSTATETNWALSYVYDVYGNLLQQNVTAGSAPSLNLTVNTANNHITNTGFTYDAAGNLTADGTHTYGYNGFSKLASVDSTAATYSYSVDDLRNRKDVGSNFTEYLRVGGNLIAERNSFGDWSDYIFLGSKRIARAEDFDRALRVYGTNSSTGQTTSFYVGNAGGLNNYTIRSGDKLYLVQYQNSGSHGGIVLGFTDSTNSRNTVRDLESYYLNDDATQTSYHFRTVDLSSLAGKVINSVAFYEETDTASGAWAMTFEHVSLVSTDGTVHPIYTGQTTSPIASITQSGGVSGTGSTVDTNRGHGTTPTLTTTYFHSDHVGSSRMLTSGNAYPIWQGTYLPFGYEYNRQISVDHYKFTGYEHDDESGLENANDRMFSSQLARFTSMDPLSGFKMNPQTLNKYTYGLNNPLKYSDPSGAEFLDDMLDDGGGGGGCDFCDFFVGGGMGGGGGSDPVAVSSDTYFNANTGAYSNADGGSLFYFSANGQTSSINADGTLTPAGDQPLNPNYNIFNPDNAPIWNVAGQAGTLGFYTNLAITAATVGNVISDVIAAVGVVDGTATLGLTTEQTGTTLFRAWGPPGAGQFGQSWTTVDPLTFPDFAEGAGLPNANSGEFVTRGILNDNFGVYTRESLPLDGRAGRVVPEVLVPNAESQITVIDTIKVDPPLNVPK